MGLVYAELGPALFHQNVHQQVCSIQFDDTRVEYAQINHTASSKAHFSLQKMQEITKNDIHGISQTYNILDHRI